MDGSFRDNIGVEAVAEVDGVDVVAAARRKKNQISSWCRNREWTEVRPVQPPPRNFTPHETRWIQKELPQREKEVETYHSKSLYIIVKKTCKNRLTALINTASR